MRITFLTHFPGRGGSSSMLLQLVRYFRSRGHTPTVIAGRDSVTPVIDEYVVFSTPARGWRDRLREYRGLVEDTRPDVVYYVSGLEEADLLRFLKQPRVRHVFTLERHEFLDVPFWLRQLSSYWEICTANTPDVLDEIRSGNKSGFLGLFVPYDVDPAFHAAPPRQPEGPSGHDRALEVCYIGRLERFQKRAHWIPEIVQRCRNPGLRFEWHIYGEGPCESEIRRDLIHRRCEDRVHFHGWTESSELARRVARHDVFMSCSRFEGLPVAMVEAMFCGLACLAPDIPGGIRYLMSEGGGWLYAADSPRHVSDALLEAARDLSVVKRKKVEARRRIAELCGRGPVQRQYDELERSIQRVRHNGRMLDLEKAAKIRLAPFRTLIRQYLKRLAFRSDP
jgi:glycosyltransferase involved in cell wall biosynthesis